VPGNDWGKIATGVAALLTAAGGLLLAVRGGGDPAPAVIVIRNLPLPEVADTLSDSELDREWMWSTDG